MTRASPFGQPFGMFDQAQPPAFWTPFNMNLGSGILQQLLQVFLPQLAQSFGGPGNFPAQFLPTQNLWDQFGAQRYWQNQQFAMSQGAQTDVLSIHQTLMGIQRAMTGRTPTVQAQQQLRGMAESIGNILPIASMFLGPDILESVMGPRGSATILASQVHRGLRSARDPFTGAPGIRARTAGLLARELYGQLYGPGADISEMRGITAGQAGAILEELQLRGLAGPELGSRVPEDRLRAVTEARFDREGTRRRVVEAYLRGRGAEITPTTIGAAHREIFGPEGTLARTRAGLEAGDMDIRRAMEMPGVEELLTATEAQTISGRLKSLSGVVSAMRDIFGDAGQPNAPMREIIHGLEALTQGGISTMTPGQLEQMVRTTRNLATTSGLGIQGMLGLQAQMAGMADQLGIDRGLVVGATQQTAAWATAARQTQRLDMPVFGRLTAEEQTLLNTQIQMGGMGSQIGNLLGATIRMQQEGLIDAESDAARLARAIATQQNEWVDARGRRRSVAMSNAEWVELMRRAGATRATAEAVLADEYMSQQYIRDFELGGLARQLQRSVDIEPRVARTFGSAIGAQIQQQGVGEVLQRRMGMDVNQLNTLISGAATQAAEQFFNIDARTINDREAYNREMGRIAEEAIASQIRAQGGRDVDVQAALEALGPIGPDGARQGAVEMGITMSAELGHRIRYDPHLAGYRSHIGLWQMHNAQTVAQQRAQITEAQTTGRIQAAMSQVARQGPIARIVGELQGAPEERTLTDIFTRVMGFVPAEDLERTALGGVRIALQEFDRADRYTAEAIRTEEIDREIARRQGTTLTDYRMRLQQATRRDRERMVAEHARLRTDLEADQQFMERVEGVVGARIGTLTDLGVQQRNLQALIMEGLTAGGRQAEEARLNIARYVGGEGVQIGDMTATWWETRIATAASPEERRRIENLRTLSDILQGAQGGRVTGDQLRRMGIATEAIVGGEEVATIVEMGEDVRQRTERLRAPAADDQGSQAHFTRDQQRAMEASRRFLQNTRAVSETIQASVSDMEQLGREGGEAIRMVDRQRGELDALASQASEQLGRPVTAAELLAGKGPAALVQQAREAAERMRSGLAEVARIKQTGYLPGKGASEVTPLGAYERRIVEERARFIAMEPEGIGPEATVEERAVAVQQAQSEYVVSRLLRNVTAATAAGYGEGSIVGRESLREVITGRELPLVEALTAREQLVGIAAAQGLIKGPGGEAITEQELGGLSAAQREAAIAALRGRRREDLGAELHEQVTQLLTRQEPLEDIGRDDLSFREIQERIERFGPAQRPEQAATAADRRMTATMSGTLTITGTGETGQISGTMELSDYNYNEVHTAMIG